MLRFINHIIDRCLFTLAFIVGVQLPGFIQQYLQRLSGHLVEAERQLAQFQSLADIHFNGQLNLLINNYLSNSDAVIANTGKLIEGSLQRVSVLSDQVAALQNDNYVEKIIAFTQQIDLQIAQATLTQYQLNVPLTIDALITGTLFSFAISSTWFGIGKGIRLLPLRNKSKVITYNESA